MLILAPQGRDAQVIVQVLARVGVVAASLADLAALVGGVAGLRRRGGDGGGAGRPGSRDPVRRHRRPARVVRPAVLGIGDQAARPARAEPRRHAGAAGQRHAAGASVERREPGQRRPLRPSRPQPAARGARPERDAGGAGAGVDPGPGRQRGAVPRGVRRLPRVHVRRAGRLWRRVPVRGREPGCRTDRRADDRRHSRPGGRRVHAGA